jgi:hypothetical protein
MARAAPVVLVAILAGACTTSGAPSGAPGLAWDVRDAPGAVDDVVSTGDLIVAAGATAPAGDPGARPVVWRSADGQSWESATLDGDGRIAALVANRGRFVAAGTRASGSETRARAWTSPDATAWTPVGDDAFVPGSGCASTNAEDVATGPGGYVVVGTEWGEGCGQHAAAWSSPDGLTWSRVALPSGGHTMHSALAGVDGYVAVGAGTAGADEGLRAAFWFSPDGRTWTQAPDDVGNHGAEAFAVSTDPSGFLAVGTAITAQPPGAMVPAAWRSSDGRSWVRLAAEGLAWDAATAAPGQPVTGLALTSDVLVVPRGVLALGAGMTMGTGQAGGAQQASPWRYLGWVSSTGETWTRVADDPALLVGTVNTYVLGPSAAVVHDGRLFLFGARWPESSADPVGRTGLPTMWEADATAIGSGG